MWARDRARSTLDSEIWRQFARFERGLKLYWWKTGRRRDFLGKRKVRELCKEGRPELDESILVDQRGVGMLGTHITSLRSIGLIEPRSLLVQDEAARQLIGDFRFSWSGRRPHSWQRLREVFQPIEQTRRYFPRLGQRLFSYTNGSVRSDSDGFRMRAAAVAMRQRRSASSWHDLSSSLVNGGEQRRIASATRATSQLEATLRQLFEDMLDGHKRISQALRRRIASQGGAALTANPFPQGWRQDKELATPLRNAMRRLSSGSDPVTTIFRLHRAVVQDARGGEPWLFAPGQPSAVRFQARSLEHDYRFSNCRSLIRQTRWHP